MSVRAVSRPRHFIVGASRRRVGWRDLSSYIAALDAAGQLLRVAQPVDVRLEAGCAADLAVKAAGPALLFEKPRLDDGSISEFPLVMNLFGSRERVMMALGVNRPSEVGERMVALMKPDVSAISRRPWQALPLVRTGMSMAPKRVRRAPCQQVRMTEPDVTRLPIPTTWPLDAGPFVTLPLVVTRDRNSGLHNLGMYRSQVFGRREMGLHWQTHKHGADHAADHATERTGDHDKGRAAGPPDSPASERIPVAICLGGPPELIFSAIAPLPDNLTEYEFTGFLQRRRLRLVEAMTQKLLVPADCEVVIEGYWKPEEKRGEGPFGDHFGYYSLESDYPYMHVTAITHRRNAVVPMTIVGKPPMEDGYLGEAIGDAFLPVLRFQHRDVVDLFLPLETGFHNLAIVASAQRYPRQARKTALGLWGAGQMMFLKTIVAVDPDHDVKDLDALLDALDSKVLIERDLTVLDGMVADTLAHAAPWENVHSKLLIDATTPAGEDHDRRSPSGGVDGEMVRAIAALADVTDARLLRSSIVVVLTKARGVIAIDQLKNSIWQLEESRNLRWLLLTDDEVSLDQAGARRKLLWQLFCRFEVSRDLHFDAERRRVCWDATTPLTDPEAEPPVREWPPVCEHDDEVLEKVRGWLRWE